jgi:hypothetical protein
MSLKNDPICDPTQGGQGKDSHVSLLLALLTTNVANVNEPLTKVLKTLVF